MVSGMTLVGRTAEVALVERVLDALPDGPSRVLAISGEPGIGKSRLLMELRGLAARRGYIVLSGRGTELETEEPFAALVEALDDFLASLEPRRLHTLSERLPHLSEVLPTFGALAETQPGPAGERYRHHRAIQALLEELAATRPLVLVLDDVHWADAASLEAIAHLLRRPPSAPILLVLAFRAGQEPPMLSSALEAADREGSAELMRLATLTEEQTAQLLDGRARAPSPPDLPGERRQPVLRRTARPRRRRRRPV